MKISDILARKGSNVVTTGPDTTVGEFVQLLAEHRIGAIPVVTGSRLSGIVSERDVVRRLATDGPGLLDEPVAGLMTTELITCGPGDALDDIAALMTERRVRHLPVVVDGALAGIVSIGDAVAARLRELEQTQEQLESYITRG
ncbi:MAG TPA: CBS domain-containing protein [Jatrophihabitans sp.]|nr:CBS domain-containing protein [Jatrophihabitans sp.]